MKEIILSKQALKFLKKQPKPTVKRIMTAIHSLPQGDVKRLQGYNTLYRLRVGAYRVVYNDKGEILDVIRIGNRGDIYKDF